MAHHIDAIHLKHIDHSYEPYRNLFRRSLVAKFYVTDIVSTPAPFKNRPHHR